MEQILHATKISKSFGSNQVLKEISLSVSSGEVVAVIGPSGSGKSTLLRCINQFETIDRGGNPGGWGDNGSTLTGPKPSMLTGIPCAGSG